MRACRRICICPAALDVVHVHGSRTYTCPLQEIRRPRPTPRPPGLPPPPPPTHPTPHTQYRCAEDSCSPYTTMPAHDPKVQQQRAARPRCLGWWSGPTGDAPPSALPSDATARESCRSSLFDAGCCGPAFGAAAAGKAWPAAPLSWSAARPSARARPAVEGVLALVPSCILPVPMVYEGEASWVLRCPGVGRCWCLCGDAPGGSSAEAPAGAAVSRSGCVRSFREPPSGPRGNNVGAAGRRSGGSGLTGSRWGLPGPGEVAGLPRAMGFSWSPRPAAGDAGCRASPGCTGEGPGEPCADALASREGDCCRAACWLLWLLLRLLPDPPNGSDRGPACAGDTGADLKAEPGALGSHSPLTPTADGVTGALGPGDGGACGRPPCPLLPLAERPVPVAGAAGSSVVWTAGRGRAGPSACLGGGCLGGDAAFAGATRRPPGWPSAGCGGGRCGDTLLPVPCPAPGCAGACSVCGLSVQLAHVCTLCALR